MPCSVSLELVVSFLGAAELAFVVGNLVEAEVEEGAEEEEVEDASAIVRFA